MGKFCSTSRFGGSIASRHLVLLCTVVGRKCLWGMERAFFSTSMVTTARVSSEMTPVALALSALAFFTCDDVRAKFKESQCCDAQASDGIAATLTTPEEARQLADVLSVYTASAALNVSAFSGSHIVRMTPWYPPATEPISSVQKKRWEYNEATFNGGTVSDLPVHGVMTTAEVLDHPGAAKVFVRELNNTTPPVGVQAIWADSYDRWAEGFMAELRCAGAPGVPFADAMDLVNGQSKMTAAALALSDADRLKHGCGIAGANIGVIDRGAALTRGPFLYVTADIAAAKAAFSKYWFWNLIGGVSHFMTVEQFKSQLPAP